ncbi:MAG: cbb3-type cytochrome c oxidase N-terminal domain-containing protein [Opitutaceae bacterium]|nr:cbb3-type cytochrome c oxidase N-terminal domain-containing protein [Opitutaceae bacterium]
MNPPSSPSPDAQPEETKLRSHVYDGIQEYDHRLPNWWLFTMYGAIVFAVVYWFAHQVARLAPSDGEQVDAAMAQIQSAKMASSIDVNNDPGFWQMSRNPVFIEAGRATFNSTCASCHTAALTGAIGPNLVDRLWIHGGTPKEIYKTVSDGVPAKGMPAWGPVLGAKKVAETVAYILSYHKESEPIEVQVSWAPPGPAAK